MTLTESTATTRFATSSDGTRIAYDVTGTGPALVIVEGALCHRAMGVAKMVTPEALPSGRVETLAGQTHMVKPKVVAPVATRHLLGG